MTTLSRRALLELAAAGATVATGAGVAAAAAAAAAGRDGSLKSLTSGAQPISAQEHDARLAKVQGRMQQRKVAALLLEAGSSLEYFTGIHWWRSERTTAALIPAEGRVVLVTPFFEEPSVRETLKVAADVRTWKEDESPFDLIADAFREHAGLPGPLAVESTTRFFIIEHVVRTVGRRANVVVADELVNACRMIKSPAELALMQTANDVTITALRHMHAAMQAGMHSTDIMSLMIATTSRLGGAHEFSLVLLNEASAYPHGSVKPQQVREGSVHPHRHRLQRSRLPVRHLQKLDLRRPYAAPARGLEHGEARPGARARDRESRHAGRRDRSRSAHVLRAEGVESATTRCRACRIEPVTGSAWTPTRRPIWCAAIRRRCRRGCASPTSRGSTSPENSVSASRTVGT